MIAPGRARELVGDNQLTEWQPLDWITCDCGSATCAPRNQQGYIGKWALCVDTACRQVWRLSQSGEDVIGNLDGVMPQEFHARLVGV